MNPISLRDDKATSGGSFARYYKLNKNVGIKVLRSKGSLTPNGLLRSKKWKEAKHEVAMLERAASSGIVPKCYGLRVVKIGGRFFAGIAMQHLGEYTLGDRPHDTMNFTEVEDSINKKLKEIGIQHGDLHHGNIMSYRKKYYVIDFGLAYLTEQEYN